MGDPISVLSAAIVTTVKVVPEVVKGVNSAVTRNPQSNELIPSTSEFLSEDQVRKAKEILNQPIRNSSPKLNELASTVNEVEKYLDWANYASKPVTSEEKYRNINENLDKLSSALKTLVDQLTLGKSSTSDNTSGKSRTSDNEVPDYHEVRTCLLFLSLFPKSCVFNRSRVTRLLAIIAHIVFRNGKDGPTLKQLAGSRRRLEEVGSSTSSLDGSNALQHFLIGDVVKTESKDWPESVGICKDPKYEKMVRFIVIEAEDATEGQRIIEQNPHKKNLCSLIYLGEKTTIDLKIIQEFKLLRILSLRNVKLENGEYLENLCLLKYLDLKHSDIRDCKWLKGLEELEMLDLRHTYVEKIPEAYLEKLGKLQFLLLGYIPDSNPSPSRFPGAELDIEKFNGRKNLKILRKIKWSKGLDDLTDVSDLSVTNLKTENEIDLWKAVGKLNNVTRLGLAAADTLDLLQHCQSKAKDRLRRLCLEGKFISGFSGSTSAKPNSGGLQNLQCFQNLIDLTLAPSKPINVDEIPPLDKLLCLRLYCVSKGPTMRFKGEGFKKMKKLVIGNMKEVKNIEISKAMVEGLDTLKLCDLPKFEGLLSFESKVPFLRIGESRGGGFEPIHSQKTVFLKGDGFPIHKICVEKSPNIAIYIYERNKQCYKRRG